MFSFRVLVAACVFLVGVEADGKVHVGIQLLIQKLQAPSFKKRVLAARSLSRLGPKALPALAALQRALKDKHPEVRGASAYAIGKIGPGGKAAIGALRGAMLDVHPWVQGYATVAMARMGAAGHRAMMELLQSRQASARSRAAIALAMAGKRTASILPALRHALHDKHSWVRYYSVRCIRAWRAQDTDTLVALLLALADPHKRVVAAVMSTLALMGREARFAIPVLLLYLELKHRKLQRVTIRSLGRFGIASKPVVSALKAFLTGKDILLRFEAHAALKRLGVVLPLPSYRKTPTSRRSAPRRRPAPRRLAPRRRPASRR